MVALIWGGTRYAWSSPPILTLVGTAAVLAGALALRERRAEDPIVPLGLLRTPVVAIASAGMFLATASLFAVTVFVPLFLQATTGASATQAGLLLIPMMLGLTASTNFAGRSIERTGRYKRFPVAGLAMMAGSLALLAALAGDPSRLRTGIAIAVFGLGFGMVSQVLIVAVQNSVDRRELGIAMATASFFRGLGGAAGAAILGAVFAARAGAVGVTGGPTGLGPAARADVIDAVQTVFIVAAPIAAAGLLVVLVLREVPLRGRGEEPEAQGERPGAVPEGASAERSVVPKQRIPVAAAR
jgi:predicted MFS family arabinose efflux permease